MKKQLKKLEQIVDWAAHNDDIRAVLLTSSLVNPLAPVDEFSDLDIELVVENLSDYLNDDRWLSFFGQVLSSIAENEEAFDGNHAMRMVLYEDYIKVDFLLYRVSEFRRTVNQGVLPEGWDIGYQVLIDKDQLTTGMKPPSYQASLIKKPTEQRFNQLLNDFWWDMTYVAKCLARDEIFYAKFMTENVMRTNYLVPLLEWSLAMQHDWQLTTNKHGRLFKQYVSPERWQEVEATFSGSNLEDNWRALLAYADLVHQLGTEIAEKLGFNYPTPVENKIRKYLLDVKRLSD